MGGIRREVEGKRAQRAGGSRGHTAALSAVGALSITLVSCALFFPRAITVARWSPVSARPDVAGIETWVEFSAPVDMTKAEQAFTLTEDGGPMAGRFSWAANRLVFEPLKAISTGKSYEMTVGASVEDARGVSLDKEFRFSFTTRSDASRPEVLSVTPGPGAVIDDRFTVVTLEFSEGIDVTTFMRAFSLSPDAAGVLSWSQDRTRCEFTPAAPYEWQTEYVVRLADALADADGNRLAEKWESRFFVGSDRVAPRLQEVRSVQGGTPGSPTLAPDDPAAPGLEVTGGWECAWGFRLTFNEQVSRTSVEQSLLLEPGFGFAIEPAADAAVSFVLEPTERLAWDTVYTLAVRAGVEDMSGNTTTDAVVFHFRTDAGRSRPPMVAAVRFRGTPLSEPAAAVDLDPAVPFAALPIGAEHFPVAVAEATWFDLQLRLADTAGLDLLSVMEHFSIQETNGCLSIRATALQTGGFDDPQPQAVAGAVPVRIHVTIVNAVESGTITLGLSEGFADSLGNPTAAAWRLPLLK
jgi:hypothetical protein